MRLLLANRASVCENLELNSPPQGETSEAKRKLYRRILGVAARGVNVASVL